MKIRINVFGTDIRLNQEISLELAAPTLKDVLRALKGGSQAQWAHFIQDDLSVVEGSVILVNGRNVWSLDGLGTKIHQGDEITFTVLVAGG
jgi:molybdopterin converting factor small subunit